jgi:ABC-type uncharacterized transport system involved in gliding motility auxiliary subunit
VVRARLIAGIAAVLAIVAALNLWAVTGEFLHTTVIGLLVVGGAAAAGSLFMTIILAADKAERGRTLFGFNAIIAAIAFFCICVVLFALARRSQSEWDLTREGRRELSEQTIRVLEGLDNDVVAFALFVDHGDSLSQQTKNKTLRFLRRCAARTPYLKIEEIDPITEQLRMREMKLTVASNIGTVALRSGTRQRVIPVAEVTSRLEERDFTNALINVSRDAEPLLYFLQGHGENEITSTDPKDGASHFKRLLENESYVVDTLELDLTNPVIPSDCSVLIVNGPDTDFRAQEIRALDNYIANGGRILLLLDIWRGVDTSGGRSEYLRPWLNTNFGIDVSIDIIMQGGSKPSPELPLMSDFGSLLDSMSPDIEQRGSFNDQHPITAGFGQAMALLGGRSVARSASPPAHAKTVEILHTTPNTWAETDLDRALEGRVAPDPTETKGPISIAVASSIVNPIATGEGSAPRDARIVVVGNRSFTNNERINYQSHRNFVLNSMAWLTEQPDLISIRPTGSEDQPIILTPRQERWISYFSSLGILEIVVFVGIVVFVLRRNLR